MVSFTVDQQENGKIRCDACPVLCYIKDGRTGACDRYANDNGMLVRVDAFTILERKQGTDQQVVSFLPDSQAGDSVAMDADDSGTTDETAAGDSPTGQPSEDCATWDGNILGNGRTFVTAIGSGTTYPDYKPAPFIVSQRYNDVDMVTVVTEGIFSYCGVKVKIDTDRHLGPEQAI
ncbi:MAG: hypothetical protein AB8B63_04520, partial [Granulosicoccus sp.]